jgi:hypothetical protein
MQGFLVWALVTGTIFFTSVFILVAVRDYLNAPLALALVLIAAMSILWLIDRFVVELMSNEDWTYGLITGAVMAIALVIWGLQPYLRNF